jgi:uncharacterized protein YkwD
VAPAVPLGPDASAGTPSAATVPTAALPAAALPAAALPAAQVVPAAQRVTDVPPVGSGCTASRPAAASAPSPTSRKAAPRPAATKAAAPPVRAARPAPARTTAVPAAKAAAAAPAAPSSAFAGLESQVVALTNAQRVANGCKAVRVESRLTVAARGHSADMAANNYFSHVSPSGGTFTSRAVAAGYRAAMSENIAWGWPTAQVVVDEWMRSPGHRANILNCGAVTVGVGVAKKADGTLYWTQMFGRS